MATDELSSSLRSGDALFFIGAGLSAGAGLPNWPALVEPLARSVGARWPASQADLTTDHLITGAQYFENQQGRNALIRHLQDELDTTGVEPTGVHKFISSLPVRTIFTTNYDDLIERSLRAAGRRASVTVNEAELAYWDGDRAQVVKICGDLQRPESIVITKQDFTTYAETHRRLVEQLRAALETRTALFLGYSLQDPFFNQIWDGIGLTQGRHRRRGYAVLFDAPALEVEDWQRRGLQIINIETTGRDRTKLLLDWLSPLGVT